MASRSHQFMLALVARKMRTLGFEPIAYDGDPYSIGTTQLNLPPTIMNHRPDIVGINIANQFCIGEVKTINDLDSIRTKNQLIDFSKDNEFIFCFPKKAQEKISRKLNNLGIMFKRNIHLLFVPDELIPYDEN